MENASSKNQTLSNHQKLNANNKRKKSSGLGHWFTLGKVYDRKKIIKSTR